MDEHELDVIVDLMEKEHGASSKSQDTSARNKFNSYLDKHVAAGLTLSTMKSSGVAVTKSLIGKFTSFLLEDPRIGWQTSFYYLSSVKRQLEVELETDFFERN